MKKLLKIGDFKVLWLFVLGIGIGVLVSIFVPKLELEEAVAQQSKSPTIVNEMVVRKLKVVDAEGNIVLLIDSNAAGGRLTVVGKDGKVGVVLGTMVNYENKFTF